MNEDSAVARLTTHVLDLTSGSPAAGLRVVLSRLDDPATGQNNPDLSNPDLNTTDLNKTELVITATNDDGRTDEPLLVGADLAPGRYELAFSVGDYFAGSTVADDPTTFDRDPGVPFLAVVPVRFGVAAATAHLHVALLVTPWSYTTYRGS